MHSHGDLSHRFGAKAYGTECQFFLRLPQACRCPPFLTLLHQLLRHLALFFSNVAVRWHQQGQQHHIKILVMHALHVSLNASLTFHSGRCGVFGGVLATVFNNPFDVVVSRARNIIDYNGAPYKYVFARCAMPRRK